MLNLGFSLLIHANFIPAAAFILLHWTYFGVNRRQFKPSFDLDQN